MNNEIIADYIKAFYKNLNVHKYILPAGKMIIYDIKTDSKVLEIIEDLHIKILAEHASRKILIKYNFNRSINLDELDEILASLKYEKAKDPSQIYLF